MPFTEITSGGQLIESIGQMTIQVQLFGIFCPLVYCSEFLP